MCLQYRSGPASAPGIRQWHLSVQPNLPDATLSAAELRIAGQATAGLEAAGQLVAEAGVSLGRQGDVVPTAGVVRIDRDLGRAAVELELAVGTVGVGERHDDPRPTAAAEAVIAVVDDP